MNITMQKQKLSIEGLVEFSGIDIEPFDSIEADVEQEKWVSAWLTYYDPRIQITHDQYQKLALFLAHSLAPTIGKPQLDHLTSRVERVAPRRPGSLSRVWRDYCIGMALVFDPLPPAYAYPGFTSDLEAIHSDWLNVRSDIAIVWTAMAKIHNLLIQSTKENTSG